MIRPESPCFQCVERSVGCHATCTKYQEFRDGLTTFSDNIADGKQKQYIGARHWKQTSSGRWRVQR